MNFARIPLAEAEGAILAHSLALAEGRLRKGTVLSAEDCARLAAAGYADVVAARIGPEDVGEDEAAARIGAALAPDPAAIGLTRTAPFTGRLNLYAAEAGLVSVEADRIAALNALDEAVTLATLASETWVEPRQMVATVKIIPYAAPARAVAAAEALLTACPPPVRLNPLARPTAALVLTATPGMKPATLRKGAEAVRTRLRALGIALVEELEAPHEEGALAATLAALGPEATMVLILTGSATSDRGDVGPAAVAAQGGRIERFGMPVDPGNLLFLGELPAPGGAMRPVIGLPGCARSPKLNGADWVLERVAAGRMPDAAAIAGMGVGGLLKEIPARPAPRAAALAVRPGSPAEAPAEASVEPGPARRPRVSALLLAAGASRRMGGRDKLLELAGGEPVLRRTARSLLASGVEETVVVLRPGDMARRAALAPLDEPGRLRLIENPRAADGMGTSLAAGLAALAPTADAVLIALADMPDLEAADHDRLLAAFDA
ncbi:MAG: NTP transferase domain-containing protein, partial [Pseudomonadota bacterium]